MARTIVVLCDLCLQEGAQVPGEEIPPTTIGTMKPRVLALCPDQHMKQFEDFKTLLSELGQVTEGLTSTGRPVGRPRKGAHPPGEADGDRTPQHHGPAPRDDRDIPGALICPFPGCEVGKVQRSALRDHTRVEHGEPLAVLEARHGNGLSVDGRELTWPCHYCEASFTHGAGRSSHVKWDHPDKVEDFRARNEERGKSRRKKDDDGQGVLAS